ncbi:hypothetical protein CEXT_515921 [Caerostris extrusa]|uniref:Uncharacterized protein n=1 Tax=Caerostris extrusa TaxID=172846 RepID=A0AAV4UUG4_CAEEX|nr:hypothetical protein CEXT_515921 [Caerostris extrusa]
MNQAKYLQICKSMTISQSNELTNVSEEPGQHIRYSRIFCNTFRPVLVAENDSSAVLCLRLQNITAVLLQQLQNSQLLQRKYSVNMKVFLNKRFFITKRANRYSELEEWSERTEDLWLGQQLGPLSCDGASLLKAA